jgi:hypothetical protein
MGGCLAIVSNIADVFTGLYEATAVISLFASRFLPSNESMRHNIKMATFSV